MTIKFAHKYSSRAEYTDEDLDIKYLKHFKKEGDLLLRDNTKPHDSNNVHEK